MSGFVSNIELCFYNNNISLFWVYIVHIQSVAGEANIGLFIVYFSVDHEQIIEQIME